MLCTPWTTGDEVLLRPGMSQVAPATAAQAATDASHLLYALSGQQFPGACARVIRPMARPYNMDVRLWIEYLQTTGYLGGYSTSWGACNAARFGDHFACDRPREVDLQAHPVRSVTYVTIGGVTVSPSSYRLDDYRLLVRTDGEIWPTCQYVWEADTEPNTFEVGFTFGADPPPFGVSAAVTLAAEFALSRTDLPNRLPSRVQTITRQGISMTVVDPLTFIQQGMTGVPEVDMFVRAYNPYKRQQMPTVWSPDVQAVRMPNTRYPN